MYYKNEKTVDLDFGKLLVIVITISLFFVLPVQFATLQKNDPEFIDKALYSIGLKEEPPSVNVADTANPEEGRVAGATTDISASESSSSIFSSTTLVFIILGITFLIVSVTGIGYLWISDKPKDRN